MAQGAHQHIVPDMEHTQISPVVSIHQRTLSTLNDFSTDGDAPHVQQDQRQKKAR